MRQLFRISDVVKTGIILSVFLGSSASFGVGVSGGGDKPRAEKIKNWVKINGVIGGGGGIRPSTH